MIVINEQELLDMMISERIQMFLKPINPTNADEKKHVLLLIDQAEVILKHLPDADRNTLKYFEHLMEQMAEEEPCLYTVGFKDGIRVMKLIGKSLRDYHQKKNTAVELPYRIQRPFFRVYC